MLREPGNVALIPARSGSKRLPNKNKMIFKGIPLVAHSVLVALECACFLEVIVSTDDEEIADIAQKYGAKVPNLRPKQFATDESTDIEWMVYAINNQISVPLTSVEFLTILRPTSPMRTSKTINYAIESLKKAVWADSLRAMELTDKHPGKMWRIVETGEAIPLWDQSKELTPTHNRPTQSLPKIWVQNASLEIVRLQAVLSTNSISGKRVLGFEMPGLEGMDINTEKDWDYLQILTSEN